MKKSRWNKRTDERLEYLWSTNITSNDIAKQLTEDTGIEYTKNMVIGRSHKLRLARRKRDVILSRPRFPVANNIIKYLLEAKPNQCRYIIGEVDNEESYLCNDKSTHGPYCKRHRELCCIPQSDALKDE